MRECTFGVLCCFEHALRNAQIREIEDYEFCDDLVEELTDVAQTGESWTVYIIAKHGLTPAEVQGVLRARRDGLQAG